MALESLSPVEYERGYAEELNTRSRACWGFYTPQEVFHKLLPGGEADGEQGCFKVGAMRHQH
ncbi:hypothetical protein GCM10007147_34200 [Nocardiopsis kunsanensis]|uniref:Uncharacterized protein n=1 Tax=Nocardiopsis kunsanensis TaxID=141693 RepID=A0A918XHV8_9ACTN|nr:hypothetical protein GCM10007147_34200 [Nocardiopsis kunsanensis]